MEFIIRFWGMDNYLSINSITRLLCFISCLSDPIRYKAD